MRFLLDTNVLSELVKPSPDDGVVRWVGDRSPLDLAISVLTIGEFIKGIESMAAGKRRARLERWVREELPSQFRGRLLSIDERVAGAWGRLAAEGTAMGRPLPVIDGLLLATAVVHDLTFVTRNERDGAGRGVPVVNPWEP